MRAFALAGAVVAGCATASGAKTAGHYVNIGALRMYYEEAGTGPALVLLHGGGSTAQTSFGRIIPELSRRHHVIAPEQQAHGHTADIDRPLSFEQMADDTAALLEQLQVRDADIIGFSNGGMVALQLAIRHPRLVRRLVLCSSFHAHEGFIQSLREGFDQPPNAGSMPKPLREAYEAASPHPDAGAFVAKTVAMMRSFADLTPQTLHAIGAPALVMAGDRDVITQEHAVALARLLPHAQLAILPDAQHGQYIGAAEVPPPTSALLGAALTLLERFLEEPTHRPPP
jgi:pimeloyl-ACP methyl ester carboxylesterase